MQAYQRNRFYIALARFSTCTVCICLLFCFCCWTEGPSLDPLRPPKKPSHGFSLDILGVDLSGLQGDCLNQLTNFFANPHHSSPCTSQVEWQTGLQLPVARYLAIQTARWRWTPCREAVPGQKMVRLICQ